MKRLHDPRFAVSRLLSAGLLLLICITGIVSLFNNPVRDITIPVHSASFEPDTIRVYQAATLVTGSQLTIPLSSRKLQLLSPKSPIDSVTTVSLVLILLSVLFFFWNYSYLQPFTRKALRGLFVLFLVVILSMTAEILRHTWFNEQVQAMTDGQFSYAGWSYAFPYGVILAALLLRVMIIYRKGVLLQEENTLII